MAKAILGGQLKHSFTLANRIYSCTLCSLCKTICPPKVDMPAIVQSLRSDLVEQGFVPKRLQDVLVSIHRNGNPWGEPVERRSKWRENLDVKNIAEGDKAGILLFLGCTSSYDSRNQLVSKSIVEILNESEVDFGTLGNEEKCCGDPALRIGERGLFEELAKENLESFGRYHVNKIVTICPHCYHTFKNDYPQKIQVQHYAQFLAELIDQGKLTFSKNLNEKVIYHDSCFLGRHNSVYEEPRKVLEAIPGLSLLEMPRNRENSFCCGGGGGRTWIEEAGPNRPSSKRIEEAIGLRFDIIATSCPYCLLSLEDAIKVIDMEDKIKVKDISEIVKEAL